MMLPAESFFMHYKAVEQEHFLRFSALEGGF